MSRTFHLLTYTILVLFAVYQQLLIQGYDLMNDQLLRTLDQAMAACGMVFHHL